MTTIEDAEREARFQAARAQDAERLQWHLDYDRGRGVDIEPERDGGFSVRVMEGGDMYVPVRRGIAPYNSGRFPVGADVTYLGPDVPPVFLVLFEGETVVEEIAFWPSRGPRKDFLLHSCIASSPAEWACRAAREAVWRRTGVVAA